MNDFEELSGDVKKLIDQFLDDTISDDGMRQLNDCLNVSPNLRTFFLNYYQMHIELGTDAAVEQRAEKAFGIFCQRREYIATASAQTSANFDDRVVSARREAATANTAVSPQALSRARLWPLAGAAVFAVVVVFLVAGGPAGLFVEKKIDREQIASRKPTANDPEERAPRLPIITALNAGKSSTTLQLKGIGYVTIDGPTDFCLVGPMRARLNYGRVKMRVTEKTGHGFVIETPDGEVTDLGTEFALNVTQGSDTSLIVREGMVDLRIGALPQANKPERLVIGEGVIFDKRGGMDRIMSIVSTDNKPFQSTVEEQSDETPSLITSVTDNLRASETKKFYEIVPGGLREDTLAYVDRPKHEWNGVTKSGIPDYLIGADYVKTFCGYKRRDDMEIKLELSCPAKLYIFFDRRLSPPDWLKEHFRNTNDMIGIDHGRKRSRVGKGAGSRINDAFYVWERILPEACVVTLGSNSAHAVSSSMYGIAAIPLVAPDSHDNAK